MPGTPRALWIAKVSVGHKHTHARTHTHAHMHTKTAWIRNLRTPRKNMIYRANSLDIWQRGADFSPCTFGNQSFSSLESEIGRDTFEYLMLCLSVASPWSGRWSRKTE